MYFVAKMAAKSLTKQIHTEAQKSKLESWTCLEETLKKRDCIHGLPRLGEVAVDIIKDLDLESLKDLQAPSLLAHQVQGAEGERDPDVPEKKDFFLMTS